MMSRETYKDMCAILEKEIEYWRTGYIFAGDLRSADIINGDTMVAIEQYTLDKRRPLIAMVEACKRAMDVLDMQAGAYDNPLFSDCRPDPLTAEEEALIKQAASHCYAD